MCIRDSSQHVAACLDDRIHLLVPVYSGRKLVGVQEIPGGPIGLANVFHLSLIHIYSPVKSFAIRSARAITASQAAHTDSAWE